MRTISITARKRDERAYGVQKYDNNETWNVEGGAAPNGVSATRYLRKTTPDVALLSPLAAWLVAHVPEYCGGKMPAFNFAHCVRCYNGKSEAQTMREEFPSGMRFGVSVENYIKGYDLENQPTVIDDWLFDIIDPSETDEQYWNRTAAKMLLAGVIRITIGDTEWRA